MKRLIAIATTLGIVGSALATPNFIQSVTTGDNRAWGPIGDFSFEDDLIVDSGSWDISSITTYDLFDDADTYTLNLWTNYTDQGGMLIDSWTTTNLVPDATLGGGEGGVHVIFDTTGLNLGPGTYIIQYTANSLAFGGDYAWYNSNVGNSNGNDAYIAGLGGSTDWPTSDESFDMSWEIAATPVPEPATMAVLGLGLAALARRRRK